MMLRVRARRGDDGRMTGEAPLGNEAAAEWTLEGHFFVGGSGLYVHRNCVGQTFTARTANYTFILGLPQLDTGPEDRSVLVPPEWTCGPGDKNEQQFERNQITWGSAPSKPGNTVIPASAQDTAIVYRARFSTAVAGTQWRDVLTTAADDFLNELDAWWTRFTSWVGVLTAQDFVGLAGYAGQGIRSARVDMWAGNASGQRVGQGYRSNLHPPLMPVTVLGLNDLCACVTAASVPEGPPEEWLFIRDARSLLSGGERRRAILDAGTAAELAMTTLIDTYLDDVGADEGTRAAITRGYGNLGAKRELLSIFRPNLLSTRVQPDLIEKRNTAIHGRTKAGHSWEDITFEQAQTVVEIATEIVKLAHPLTRLLPGALCS